MFFVIDKVEQSTHRSDSLQNPKKPTNPMVLAVYRQLTRTALFSAYSNKAFGEYWDDIEQKAIARRHWTPEMKAFANLHVAAAPKPPYLFKVTIIGWLFILIMIGTLGLIIYQEVKPPAPKSAEYVAMEQRPEAGDIYFGHYEAYDEAEQRVASAVGFGWFKVLNVTGDTYYIAKSTQMSKNHQPKEALNSSAFEETGIAMEITEQSGYMMTMKSADGKMEIAITDKK